MFVLGLWMFLSGKYLLFILKSGATNHNLFCITLRFYFVKNSKRYLFFFIIAKALKMDESADDPMFGDACYSKDNNNSDIILLGDADDAKNEQVDNAIAVRDESCYSNDIIDIKGVARLVFNINKWYFSVLLCICFSYNFLF